MHGQEALQILREFVADVMVAHDNSYSKVMAALEEDTGSTSPSPSRGHMSSLSAPIANERRNGPHTRRCI